MGDQLSPERSVHLRLTALVNHSGQVCPTKRSGKQCQSPAVRGYSVCRMHGAGGGAPRGNRNALKHRAHTAEARALNREIQALARMAQATMREIK
jgi:hypothetical protein